jgi:methyl-accepting chemotaxis protein
MNKNYSILRISFFLLINCILLISLVSCIGETKEQKEARLMKAFKEEARPIVEELYEVYEKENKKIITQVENASNDMKVQCKEAGGFKLNRKKVNWVAINQYTKLTQVMSLPKIMIGNTNIEKINSFEKAVPLIDELAEKYTCELTIFQKMNDEGGFLRVASTIKKLNGERAIGTYIPANNPDGKENPVTSTILSGRTYKGRAFIVNAWYKTKYEPIQDKSGNIIGCIQTACKIDYQDSVRKKMMKTYIGMTGLVFAISGKGQQRGNYIISAGGKSDGKNILKVTDTKGRPIVKEMLDIAMAADKGEVTYYTYPWMNRGEIEPRKKGAALIYFDEWDWVVGASAYLEEFDYEE